jgi:ribose/xylose/arabinose/galactoside ABC-type transport system permease subunit
VATTTNVGDALASARASAARAADERLGHRGPIQRLLVRAEIGALIGSTSVGLFYWLATREFGTAAGAASYLEIAANTGFVAVFVALLMIGGEFDLSAGAMTGTSGILVGLLAEEIGRRGISVFIAVPIGLLVAAAIGFWNGQMVNRTRLPSFIVTLGTFYILQGATLGFTKQINGKVFVDKFDKTSGFSILRKVFASEFTYHGKWFGLRDAVFTVGLIAAVTLMVIGVLLLTYRRLEKLNAAGFPLAGIGAAFIAVGFIGLLRSDGKGSDWVLGAVLGAGIVVGMVGVGRTLFVSGHDGATTAAGATAAGRDGHPVAAGARPAFIRAGAGVVLVALGILFSVVFDEKKKPGRLFLITTEQGLRAILAAAGILVGIGAIGLAARRAAIVSRTLRLEMMILVVVTVTAVAFIIQSEAKSRKLRVELFSVLLLLAALALGAALVEYLHPRRTYADRHADRRGTTLVIIGAVLGAIGLIVRMLFSGAVGATFRISILWWIVATAGASLLLLRTRFGSWIFSVGGNKDAARSVGVPVVRVKTTLFVMVSIAGWFAGMMAAFHLNGTQANQGVGKELEYIVAAVVGGNLMTGGYGSAAGASLGALVTAFTAVGIPYAGWNSNWNFLFLGAILLLSVLVNNFIRTRAQAAKR